MASADESANGSAHRRATWQAVSTRSTSTCSTWCSSPSRDAVSAATGLSSKSVPPKRGNARIVLARSRRIASTMRAGAETAGEERPDLGRSLTTTAARVARSNRASSARPPRPHHLRAAAARMSRTPIREDRCSRKRRDAEAPVVATLSKQGAGARSVRTERETDPIIRSNAGFLLHCRVGEGSPRLGDANRKRPAVVGKRGV